MTNDETVREAWNVLRRFGQVPLPVDADGAFHNPRTILQVSRTLERVQYSSANGDQQDMWFDSEEAAQGFLEAILMHWSLVR